jgi:hypothetical protein
MLLVHACAVPVVAPTIGRANMTLSTRSRNLLMNLALSEGSGNRSPMPGCFYLAGLDSFEGEEID